MKIIIKNPAPSDSRKEKWGDYHFGRCLGKYFTRLGVKVINRYWFEWDKKDNADAVIVLRGKYPYQPRSGLIHILWVISHPGTVTLEECEYYDAVCVASRQHAEKLKENLNLPVYSLLQCTDTEEFFPPGEEGDRRGIVFVGNTRGVLRPSIIWAEEYGLPLKIWGRGWEQWTSTEYIAGDYIDNEELGRLYASARFTFNDHWNDMRSLGYINNRIFDALACGLPVISDFHKELYRLFPDEILYYSDRESFFSCLEKMLLAYPEYQSRIAGLIPRIKEEFSFKSRADFLFNLIEDLKKGKKSALIPPKVHSKRLTKGVKFTILNSLELMRKEFKRDKNGHSCLLCGSRDEMLFSPDSSELNDGMCRVCASSEFHRFFWVYFSAGLMPRLGEGTKHFLHVSPDPLISKIMRILPDIDYISADPYSSIAMVRIDLNDIRFPIFRFNIVMCSYDIITESENWNVAKEIFRVLKPGNGYAIIPLPQEANLIKALGDEEITPFSIKFNDIMNHFADVGFNLKIIRPYDLVERDFAHFLGLKDQIFLECQKTGG